MVDPKDSKGNESVRLAEALESSRRFATVCLSYEQARRECDLTTRKQYEEAYREYTKAVRDTQFEAEKHCEDAAQKYWSAIEQVESEEDARERASEAYQDYQDAVREAHQKAQRRTEGAGRTYTNKLNETRISGQKLWYEAYRSYLRSVQELWSRIDVDALAQAYALTSTNQPVC